jgi:NitT/TauT family transport system ATP-binding protein
MSESTLPSYLEQSDAVRERFERIKQREVILEVKNLYKRYQSPQGETEALRNINFKVSLFASSALRVAASPR